MSNSAEGFKVTGEQFQTMLKIISQNPADLLLSEACRKYLATDLTAYALRRIWKR